MEGGIIKLQRNQGSQRLPSLSHNLGYIHFIQERDIIIHESSYKH